jgi:hypothetical protein
MHTKTIIEGVVLALVVVAAIAMLRILCDT